MRTKYVTVVKPMVFLIVSTFVPSPIMETENQTGHRYHELLQEFKKKFTDLCNQGMVYLS